MVKRVADWLEKMSVAVMAVGIFQGVWYGIFLGVAMFHGKPVFDEEGGRAMSAWFLATLVCAGVFAFGMYLTRKCG